MKKYQHKLAILVGGIERRKLNLDSKMRFLWIFRLVRELQAFAQAMNCNGRVVGFLFFEIRNYLISFFQSIKRTIFQKRLPKVCTFDAKGIV